MENQRIQSLRPQRSLTILRKSAKDIQKKSTPKHTEVQNCLASVKCEERKVNNLTPAQPYNKGIQKASLFSKYINDCKSSSFHSHTNDLSKGEIGLPIPSFDVIIETEPVILEGRSANCSPLRAQQRDDRKDFKFPVIEKNPSVKKQTDLLAVWLDKMMKKYCHGNFHDPRTAHAAKLINEECFKETLKLVALSSEALCNLLKKTLRNKKMYEKCLKERPLTKLRSSGEAPRELDKLTALLKQKDTKIHSLQEELLSFKSNKMNISIIKKRRIKSGTGKHDAIEQPLRPTIRHENKDHKTYEGLIENSMRNFEISLQLINEATKNIKQTREAIQIAN